jgi:hypothetical protein
LAVAGALGLALVLWLPYLASRAFGIVHGTRLAVGLLAPLAAGVLVHWLRRGASAADPGARWPSVLALVAFTAMVGWFLRLANLHAVDGGLWSADAACEDMGFHATLAHAFLHSHAQVLTPRYPIYPGWPLGYPFLPDFVAAAAMALGAPVGAAFFGTAAFALVVLVTALYGLGRRWLAPPDAVLAVVLFLLGGNLGIVLLLRDLPSVGFARVWLDDYTNSFARSLHYGNMVTAVLLPMRTSMFGAAIGFGALSVLWRTRTTRRDAVVFGALLGSLPLVNAHAFLAVGLCAAAAVARDPRTQLARWWPAAVVAAALALPQLLWIHRQMADSATPFIRRANGFLFDTTLSWPTYWLLNGGLFVPLALVGLATARRELRWAALPLVLLLPLCMLVSFQPNPFDDIKLLLFFHAGGAVLVADLCRRSRARGHGWAALAAASVLACTASGVQSWARELRAPCEMATPADREFAARLLEATDERSVVLTAQQLNHPVPFLTGRSIVLGFHNWLGQHGIPFADRAADVAEIYAGGPNAEALLARYGVTDVVVGPAERAEFPALNEPFFAGIATARATSGAYTTYRLPRR